MHLHELLKAMYVPSNVTMCRTSFWPRLREQRLHNIEKHKKGAEEHESNSSLKMTKVEREKRSERNTWIGAEETVVPSIATTPCKGAMYLLTGIELFRQKHLHHGSNTL